MPVWQEPGFGFDTAFGGHSVPPAQVTRSSSLLHPTLFPCREVLPEGLESRVIWASFTVPLSKPDLEEVSYISRFLGSKTNLVSIGFFTRKLICGWNSRGRRKRAVVYNLFNSGNSDFSFI